MLAPTSHPLHGGWPCWLTSNKQTMQKWSHKCLLSFWALFLLWTTHCAGSQWSHGEDTLKSCKEVHVLRNEGPCWLPARDWALQPLGMWGSHPGNGSCSSRQAFIWLWPACVLPSIPGETLNQNHLAKIFPDSLLSESVWDKHLLFEVTKFGSIWLCSNK